MGLKNIKSDPIEKSITNTFSDEENRARHQKDLGLEIPKKYFSDSKNDILNKTVLDTNKRKAVKIIRLCMSGIAAMFVFAFLMKEVFNHSSSFTNLNDNEDNILVSSLFINDENVECLSDSYMLGELYVDDLCFK